MSQAESRHDPSCIASSGDLYKGSIGETVAREAARLGLDNPPADAHLQSGDESESNCFKNAQCTPDGTCVLTTSEDSRLRTFILPVDLLDSEKKHDLQPYSYTTFAEPVYSFAVYPGFNLQDPTTTLHLAASRDHPLKLSSAIYPNTAVASYSLISPTTERYITPHSLIFTRSGTHFLAGSDSLISLFDISAVGSGPLESFPTIPSKRKKIVGGGIGMKGIISTLAASVDGLLAAGTFTRNIGLYDAEGRGDCIAVFSIAGEEEESGVDGQGISQLLWSPCGRYLYVAERKSDGILVYDVRVTGKRMGCLKGRNALTNQRLGVDITSFEEGHEIWAGGADGQVRVWTHPHQHEGSMEPSWNWRGHEDPVTSTIVHSSGTVAITCSGRRHDQYSLDPDTSENGQDDDITSDSVDTQSKAPIDNSLKIWRL